MKKTIWSIFIVLTTYGLISAQEKNSNLSEAIQYSLDKNYMVADSLLRSLKVQNPGDITVIIAMGYNYSWWQKHNKAIAIFKELVRENNQSVEALTGLGYSYSFAGEFANAFHRFSKALSFDKNYVEAKKGLAYNYLYQKNYSKAEEMFEDLHNQHPKNEEFLLALGKIHFLQNRHHKSFSYANKALDIDSNSEEAKNLKSLSKTEKSRMELSVFAGSASSENELSYGLRYFDFTYKEENKYILRAKFDNSLATDNIRLFSENVFIPVIWVGGGFQSGSHSFVNMELGNRFLNGNTPFVRGEYLYFTKNNIAIKTGVYSDLSPETTEYNIRLGLDFPVVKSLRFGTTYFYGKESAFSDFTRRLLITTKMKISQFGTLDFGYFFGNNGIKDESFQDKSIYGFYTISTLSLGKRAALVFVGSYERGAFYNTLVTSIGTRIKLY